MKNGKSQDDFHSIAKLLRDQNAMLKVLLRHLSHTEATVFALTANALPDGKLLAAKEMKDYLQPQIYSEMISKAEFYAAKSARLP